MDKVKNRERERFMEIKFKKKMYALILLQNYYSSKTFPYIKREDV